jgi:exonuclease SbcD
MRILHTADWHFGRTLEGRSRLKEQEDFIEELVELVQDQQIDLVLLAGDVYDSVNPPAAAEQLFYDGISRISDFGKRPVVVIAGNHDNPERLAASTPLAVKQGIHLVGFPTTAMQEIHIPRTDEQALVYALPYPSESRLKELLTESADEEVLRSAYSQRIAHILSQQAKHFSNRSVNLLMSHIYVLGGAETESERPIQVGGAYTVDTSALAVNAQYTALGHLHRPQTLKGPELIRYSGSPLAYSFSEAGQSKSVTVLEIKPGQAPELEEIYLRSGKPLVRWQAKKGIAEIHEWIDAGKDRNAWIDLEIHLDDSLSMEQIQGLRKVHEGIINIRPIFPEQTTSHSNQDQTNLPIDQLFRQFYTRQTGGAEPDEELVQLFLELIQEEDMTASAAEEEKE